VSTEKKAPNIKVWVVSVLLVLLVGLFWLVFLLLMDAGARQLDVVPW
jgi:hypothetical protein